MTEIDRNPDVHTFFVEHVEQAMRDLRVETAQETQGYLVDLLSTFSVSERIRILSEPLATLLSKALASTGPERFARMREVGDVALFICGFFPDSFDRRGLDRTYAVNMGGRAYSVLGQSVGRTAPAVRGGASVRERGRMAEVFVELGGRFHDMARVIDEVRERTAMCSEGEIVRLYERWSQSGSPALAHRLQRRGVQPMRPRGDGSVH